MNIKMTTNYQQLILKKKQKQKQMRQTTRTGTEPQKCRSHWRIINRDGGRGEKGEKGTGNKKHNW